MKDQQIQNKQVIDRAEADDGTVVDIVQYVHLEGSSDVRTAENLFFANQAGMRLKMIKIRLQGSKIRVEPSALYFMRGNLEMRASTGGGIMKGLARKLVSRESFFVNEIHGEGEVFLEPTFGHFLLHHITPGEGGIIVDSGLFFAGTGNLDISAVAQKNISSALFGGEGLFQTVIRGSGVVVLYSPVPKDEIEKVSLTGGKKLWVDGNFALARSEDVTFRAEKSSKSWFSTAVSGEALLQTFEGHGSVWIAPTQGVYEKLASSTGLHYLAQPPGSAATQTESS